MSDINDTKTFYYAKLAQLVERLSCKQEVTSSTLVFSTFVMQQPTSDWHTLISKLIAIHVTDN